MEILEWKNKVTENIKNSLDGIGSSMEMTEKTVGVHITLYDLWLVESMDAEPQILRKLG